MRSYECEASAEHHPTISRGSRSHQPVSPWRLSQTKLLRAASTSLRRYSPCWFSTQLAAPQRRTPRASERMPSERRGRTSGAVRTRKSLPRGVSTDHAEPGGACWAANPPGAALPGHWWFWRHGASPRAAFTTRRCSRLCTVGLTVNVFCLKNNHQSLQTEDFAFFSIAAASSHFSSSINRNLILESYFVKRPKKFFKKNKEVNASGKTFTY